MTPKPTAIIGAISWRPTKRATSRPPDFCTTLYRTISPPPERESCGLHFQKKHPQAKLVRVLSGEVFDVAVDLRKGSETYGKWVGVLLSGENRRQFLIPRGFAHGFLVVSDYAEFAYKCDELYHPEDEGGILWNDPDVGIVWPEVGDVTLSEKDQRNPTLAQCRMEF